MKYPKWPAAKWMTLKQEIGTFGMGSLSSDISGLCVCLWCACIVRRVYVLIVHSNHIAAFVFIASIFYFFYRHFSISILLIISVTECNTFLCVESSPVERKKLLTTQICMHLYKMHSHSHCWSIAYDEQHQQNHRHCHCHYHHHHHRHHVDSISFQFESNLCLSMSRFKNICFVFAMIIICCSWFVLMVCGRWKHFTALHCSASHRTTLALQ